MIVVSYGGGTNSTAMLVGLHERGERPDVILFADTGGEKPHTYDHILTMQKWCELAGFPLITSVRGSQPRQVADGSLEAECLRLGTMPAKAFGFGACSQKWKLDPVNRYLSAWVLERGITITDLVRFVGFDADEPHRAERADSFKRDGVIRQRYPLIEWEWGREECIAAIERARLPQPGKSACFYCPSSTKKEIMWLRDNEPALLARALEIERRALAGEGPAEIKSAKGLGRTFAWADLIKAAEDQLCLFPASGPEIDCGCYDG